MARQFGNAADYIGRQFDLLAVRGAARVGDAQLDQTLFGTDASGEVCTGVQMLAQRWMLKFLTIRGSMPFLSNEGTDFVSRVRNGELRNEAMVEAAFQVSAVEVRANMLNEETSNMHDEDRMGNATLKAIGIAGDWILLTVQITSLAGASRQVILPIPYLPIKTGL
jgi:hypothetical protein